MNDPRYFDSDKQWRRYDVFVTIISSLVKLSELSTPQAPFVRCRLLICWQTGYRPRDWWTSTTVRRRVYIWRQETDILTSLGALNCIDNLRTFVGVTRLRRSIDIDGYVCNNGKGIPVNGTRSLWSERKLVQTSLGLSCEWNTVFNSCTLTSNHSFIVYYVWACDVTVRWMTMRPCGYSIWREDFPAMFDCYPSFWYVSGFWCELE